MYDRVDYGSMTPLQRDKSFFVGCILNAMLEQVSDYDISGCTYFVDIHGQEFVVIPTFYGARPIRVNVTSDSLWVIVKDVVRVLDAYMG